MRKLIIRNGFSAARGEVAYFFLALGRRFFISLSVLSFSRTLRNTETKVSFFAFHRHITGIISYFAWKLTWNPVKKL